MSGDSRDRLGDGINGDEPPSARTIHRMSDDSEVVALLRDIRDSQRELWKVSVESEARSRVLLEQLERARSGRRLLGFVLGVIVALMAVQTYLMLQTPSDQDENKPAATSVMRVTTHLKHPALKYDGNS